jgi:hypothetical protein
VRRRPAWVALIVLALALGATGCTSTSHSSTTPTPSGTGKPTPTAYTSPPNPLPSSSVTLSTSPPPWPAPAVAGQGDAQGQYVTAAGLPYAEEMLSVHYHAHLDVNVDGKAVPVPAGVGFVGTPPNHYRALAPLHTHDASGVIHIENSVPATFTLGQFFVEWGVRLTPRCIGGLCASQDKELKVYVNGKPYDGDPGQIVLTKHEEIAILYGATGQLPSAPTSYDFPSGE